ncbi:hypothetical protein PT974_10304 [Cladobotryum mycophilum]|uniref:Rhodopsin domain-containing protein n=1 Tax=Cladobotryum mycophilum TaxID=491253 RepID=A0ABR0S9G4_9HYPO
MAASNGTYYSAAYLAESKTGLVNAFYSIPIPLEIASTAFRLWARTHGHSGFRLAFDDYFMIFATVVAVAECITGLIYGAPFGLGRHIQAVSEDDARMFLKGDYIFSHFYNAAISLTKLSVLSLYYRIFATRKFRTIVLATAAFICAWFFVIEVVLGLGCRPIQAWWDETRGNCVNKVDFTYFTNVTNLVADLWIFAIPIPVILNLQAAREKRLSLVFLFSVGLGTCAISAARLSFVFGVGSPDFTWYEASLGILSAWEPCGAILCANLPLVYRSLINILGKVKATVRSSHSRGGGGGFTLSSEGQSLKELGGEGNRTVTEVSAHKTPSNSTEMDMLKLEGIVVQRGFTQDSQRDVEGIGR